MKTRRLVILLAVALISFAASGCGYNTLTTKHEAVKGKWASVETQLQRRGDLLNNLVEVGKDGGSPGAGSIWRDRATRARNC